MRKEKEADQAQFQHIQPGEKLVDRLWEKQSSSVVGETVYIETVIAVHEPEEAEGENVEKEDERSDDGEDEP